MNCRNVKPRYFKGGLAITEYIHPGIWDEVRAFVVMTFPYSAGKIVEQAFYRSSGHNSAESFGEGFTTGTARGTWIPFNAIAVKVDTQKISDQDEDLQPSKFSFSKSNILFILKRPFLEYYVHGILKRFHDDPILAFVSYLMGGGIWDTELGQTFITNTGLNAQKLPPGCIGLTDKLVRTTTYEVNQYVGTAVSWNWHPKDVIEGASKPIDLGDPGLLTTVKTDEGERTFLSEAIFLNDYNSLKNYVKINKTIKSTLPIPNYSSTHKPYNWADDIELYKHNFDHVFGKIKKIRRTSKRRQSKRRQSKRKSIKRY